MKKFTAILPLFICLTSIFGQSNSYKVEGVIQDTLNNPLIYATVLLLEKSDSTMIDFTRTELDGSFRFKDVPFGEHIVKSTYVGYLPLTVAASSSKDNINLGVLSMTEMASELMEVVVRAAKAQIKMRGDTIEYDASTFKVPEGSSVEDLLRRLPGMEVESDGSILADGKSVSKVTVDGKAFFGSDPKAATKNLPAEGISKVQVFDTKSEEEEITGATSQAQDKTMNLELKEEFKSGGFGKVVAGVGTKETKELKGNYNKFNEKIQFSLVGVANNTGRNGLSWDDYQDFLGSQSFNFDGGTDYGFGGGGRFFSFGGSGGGIESSIQSVFFSGDNNGGIPTNYNGGVNFNYDHNKTKVNSVYYYNFAGLRSNNTFLQDKFFADFTQNENRNSVTDNDSQGHRLELKVEKELDSLHTVKANFNGAYIDQDDVNKGNIALAKDGVTRSTSTFDNTTNTTGNLVNGLLLLRKKFKKKGRSMGINTSYLNTELNSKENQASSINFYNDSSQLDSISNILRINNDVAEKQVIKANALYVEPLSKRFFWHVFYNFSDRKEQGDRMVSQLVGNEYLQDPILSRSYINTLQYNRIGSILRYSHNGINVSVGLAYQTLKLDGELSFATTGNQTTIAKTFKNYTPNININMSPVRNSYVSMGYSKNIDEPSISDLQPFVDTSNPLYIKVGNSSLIPEVYHNIDTYLSRNYPLVGVRLNINGSITWYETKITSNEVVDQNLITTVTPINIDGGRSYNLSGSVNFPIIKNKLTARTRLGAEVDESPVIVNDVENQTKSISYTPFIRLSYTPTEDMAIYVKARYRNTKLEYDKQTTQNQTTQNSSLGVEFYTKLLFGLYLDTNYDVSYFKNDRFNTDRSVPILNASVYRHFMKGNKAELRLSIYDAMNRNLGFYQGSTGIAFTETTKQALGRYVMLSLTYNIRGIKSDVRKDSWW